MTTSVVSETSGNSSKDKDALIPGFSSFDSYLKDAYLAIAEGIKASNALPSTKEFGYYKTYPKFVNIMKADGLRLQRVKECLLKRNGIRKTGDDISSVIDSNDRCLDRVNEYLLEMDGRRRNPLITKGSLQGVVPSGGWYDRFSKHQPSKEEIVLCASTGIPRPQVFFKDKIDNRNVPWIPRIKEKPNSLKPLSILVEVNDLGQECYSHPYDYELTVWRAKEDQLCKIEEKEPLPFSETPFIFIDSEEQLNDLLGDLLKVNEIAVDLEHHSYRSFMGFTCVLQISTWEKDYVVDALKLRDKLHILNEVFTKPSILKVFHGAECDIEWLQRDLSLYVVNMFDTYQASKLLGFHKLSLAHLLYKYCQVEANKEYQLFDWRRRPLPENALKYAREDTHYLLHIYREMRNELIDSANGKTNLLEAVFDRSRETCKKIYNKPTLEEDSHMTIYRRLKLNFDNRQLYALREIYRWRDRIARQEDESTGYVLPNHMMVQICRTLPREVQGILACCNPIPPLVKNFLLELHHIVLRAKEQPLVKSLVDEAVKSQPTIVEKDLHLIYPQDNGGLEFRDDLPTLLGGELVPVSPPPKTLPIISAFENLIDTKALKTFGKVKFVSPYQRYLKVLPYAIKLEKEERERKEKEEEERLLNATNSLEISSTSQKEQDEIEESPQPLAKNRSYVKRARFERGEVSIKTEEEKTEAAHETSRRSVGVIGGEVSVCAESLNTSYDKRFKRDFVDDRTNEENKSYDYSKVDFQKFQSGNSKKGKNSQRFDAGKNKRRNQNFRGKSGSKKPRTNFKKFE